VLSISKEHVRWLVLFSALFLVIGLNSILTSLTKEELKVSRPLFGYIVQGVRKTGKHELAVEVSNTQQRLSELLATLKASGNSYPSQTVSEPSSSSSQTSGSHYPNTNAKQIATPAPMVSLPDVVVSTDVHIFYYLWWGTPNDDGKWLHWDHPYLPHYNKKLRDKFKTGSHTPPDDIGSTYYPDAGLYSSSTVGTMQRQLSDMMKIGAGVAVVSWYPPKLADDHGQPVDVLVPQLLDVAGQVGMKIAFHVEPYDGRDVSNMRQNIEYVINTYGTHPAVYKKNGKLVFYVYDSYLIKASQWAMLLKAENNSPSCVRNTEFDGIFYGLVVDRKHMTDVVAAGFDGFYTYFAANGFSYGSTSSHWPSLQQFAEDNGLDFVPSVGPGYDDSRVRPWNAKNIHSRRSGNYFSDMFQHAIDAAPAAISITSYNEWHEGTQIEPTQSKEGYPAFPHPTFYLEKALEMVKLFRPAVTQDNGVFAQVAPRTSQAAVDHKSRFVPTRTFAAQTMGEDGGSRATNLREQRDSEYAGYLEQRQKFLVESARTRSTAQSEPPRRWKLVLKYFLYVVCVCIAVLCLGTLLILSTQELKR